MIFIIRRSFFWIKKLSLSPECHSNRCHCKWGGQYLAFKEIFVIFREAVATGLLPGVGSAVFGFPADAVVVVMAGLLRCGLYVTIFS